MIVKLSSISEDGHRLEDAFTLIEMIGVLAVLAILAVIIVPNLLHQLDVAASQQEVATLQGFGSALQSSICRNFYIPSQNDWASNIAGEMGMDTNDVTTNSRGLQRVFLIDPNFQIGTNAAGVLPYTQNTNGSSVQPVSPRLMLLSSIGKALPTNVASGVPAVANDFNVIWNTADGAPPTNATGFTNWTTNNAYDLKVQRINLSPLFVQLVLSTYSSSNNGLYMINPATSTVTNSAPANNGVTAYYIQNSTLRLINWPTNVNSDQILNQNSSFVYYQNAWGNTIGTPTSSSNGMYLNFAAIMANFMAAPANPSASGGITPTNVTQDFTNYLNAYDAWASSSNFPTHNAQYNAASAAQSTLTTDIANLINGL